MNSYSFLVGPLVASGALLVLVLICRWVFSTSTRDERTAKRLERARSRGDYGLLVPVATARTQEQAQSLRTVLRDEGIRCTVAADEDGSGQAVLVFRADAERARQLVGSSGSSS